MKIPASTLEPAKKRLIYCGYCTRLPYRHMAEIASIDLTGSASRLGRPSQSIDCDRTCTPESTTLPDFNQN